MDMRAEALASRETRLLELQPGLDFEDLSGNIVVVSLDHLPPYDAVSYAWDQVVKPDPERYSNESYISCQELPIHITPNLARALRYLRSSDQPRTLWVDQICIKQQDDTDKEKQVRHMGEIYSKADNVIAWLGEANEDTATVWKLFHDMRLFARLEPLQTYHLAYGEKPEEFNGTWADHIIRGKAMAPLPPEPGRLPPAGHPPWRSMTTFLRLPWFWRLWTLQEVVVSKRCHVVCGEYTMTWEDLSAGARALQLGGYSPSLKGLNGSILFRDRERLRWQSFHRAPLRELLSGTRTFETNEPHDKVYALLSLIEPSHAEQFHVRYAMSLHDLFCDVVRVCISEDRSLAVLAQAGRRIIDGTHMHSWVPDWRLPTPNSNVLSEHSRAKQCYHAAGQTEPVLLENPSPHILTLRGFLVAPIKRILQAREALGLNEHAVKHRHLDAPRFEPHTWDAMYKRAVTDLEIPVTVVKTPEHRDRLFFSQCSEQNHPRSLTPVEMLQIALRRTVTGDLYPRPKGRLAKASSHQYYPAYAAWKQRRFIQPPPPQVLCEHDDTARVAMFNRKLFVAGDDADAFLGIGLKSLRKEDWICVLLGGDLPYILRPQTEGRTEDAASAVNWTFISECYVHGLMDGEAMEWTKRPGFEYKDFHLTATDVGSKL